MDVECAAVLFGGLATTPANLVTLTYLLLDSLPIGAVAEDMAATPSAVTGASEKLTVVGGTGA
ncbi:MAG: hypothetical protein ACRDI1_11565 [Actinomycetota bacterium]